MLNLQIQPEAARRLALKLSGSPAAQKGEPKLEDRLVELFDELRIPVSRYLRGIGLSTEDSEDILQETFLRLFRRLREKGREDNLRGWVYRVAHNLAIDQHRQQRRFTAKSPQEWAEVGELLIDRAPSPEELLISKEKIDGVNLAIASLSSRQAQLLCLRIDGFRYREIGETLGMRVSTVAGFLRLAIEKLRESGIKPR
jgi:RNA polymerase sigma-70 factor, ECF subfamily